jgi:hypothetical protein
LISSIVSIKRFLDRIPLVFFLPLLVLMYTLLYYVAGRQDLHPLVITLESLFTRELLLYILVGMGAQLIDGALGMAYGVSASSFLISAGVSPAAASAAVHVAEVFTTGASGISHLTFRNVNKRLFKAMVIPGVLGAVT